MKCPACDQIINDSAPTCPSCSQDARLFLCTPDGATYGPYTMADISSYANLGRVPLGSMLRTLNGKTLTLAQMGLAMVVADAAFAGPVRCGGLSKGTKWAIVALIAAVALPIVGLGVVMMAGVGSTAITARGQAHHNLCRTRLLQLTLCVQFYVEDHGGVLPDAATWKEDVLPYMGGNRSLLVCPASGRGEESYQFNTSLSGKPVDEIDDPSTTPMIYEAGMLEGTGPHGGGGYTAYADGEVRRVPGGSL